MVETDESHVGEVLGGDGLVHVAGSGVEPRAATIGRAGPSPCLR